MASGALGGMYANDCFPGQCFCDLGPDVLSTMEPEHSIKIGGCLPSRLHGGSDRLDPGREILYWYTVNKVDLAEFLGLTVDCPKDLDGDAIRRKPYGGYYSTDDCDQRSYSLITLGRKSYWQRRFVKGEVTEKARKYRLWGADLSRTGVFTTLPRDVMDTVLDGSAETSLLWKLEAALLRLFLAEEGFPEKHMYLLLWLAVARAKCGVLLPSTILEDTRAAVAWRRVLWTPGEKVPLLNTYLRFRFLHTEESNAWDKVVMDVFDIRSTWLSPSDSFSCGVYKDMITHLQESERPAEHVAHAGSDVKSPKKKSWSGVVSMRVGDKKRRKLAAAR